MVKKFSAKRGTVNNKKLANKDCRDCRDEWLGGMNEVGLISNIDRAEIIKINNTRFLICRS